MDDVVFSITANLDLLGFSAHLSLGSSDIRTKIGSEALERLKTLDNAIRLAEKEINEYPDIYNFTIKSRRFNDSIYFVIDLRPDIIPTVGSVHLRGGSSISDYEKATGKSFKGEDRVKEFYEFYAIEGLKVATFMGLISRMHNFINFEEIKRNYLGCRTIISSGYRKKYINESGQEDYFSANFSLSNAYLTNQMGSKKGISGNSLYVEDNVARIVRYDEECNNILQYAIYNLIQELSDPYEESLLIFKSTYSVSPKIEIELFSKKYIYRRLNADVLSNFRWMPFFKKQIINKNISSDSILERLINCMKKRPSEGINQFEASIIHRRYPILYFNLNLDENVEEFERLLLEDLKK